MKEQVILENIKNKLEIPSLNEMQQHVLSHATQKKDFILYSPTGTGKTLAFAIPLLKDLKNYATERLQAVVIAPSRELVLQIHEIIRVIATDCKVTCVYGGHNVQDEVLSLAVTPTILIATPGRLLDHVKREHINITNARQLIIDEFDKCLEMGFEDEMKKLCKRMPNLSRRALTSATVLDEIPPYMQFQDYENFNFLQDNEQLKQRIKVLKVISSCKDKLDTLKQLLLTLPEGKTIVFANYRDAVDRIFQDLKKHNISCGIYHGALEQIDREKAIEMFNNDSFQVLVSTDLGARGLDIAQVQNIVHYHLPTSKEAYIHRNGRTARVDKSGQVYVILHAQETAPEYMDFHGNYDPSSHPAREKAESRMSTIYLSGGKKEKISKGDIMGFIVNHGGIEAQEIGLINVHDHYSLAAVPATKAHDVLTKISQQKIKGQKLKISIAAPQARMSKNKALL